MRNREAVFSDLMGQTIVDINGMDVGSREIFLSLSDGRKFWMGHHQDCCESVYLEDVCGTPENLLDSPICMAEEVSDANDPEGYDYGDSSHTWTFYRIATNRGMVVLRWLGESNGYYGETVDFQQVTQ